MLTLTIETSLPFEDLMRDVTVTGRVVELSERELVTTLLQVDGLPPYTSLADLSPAHQESLILDLEAEFEARQRRQRRLKTRMAAIAASLRSSLDMGTELKGPLAAHERLGSLQFACESAAEQLSSLIAEDA